MRLGIIILSLLFVTIAVAQESTISGTVLFDGEGIPGATVQLKQTTFGTISNANGSFIFSNVPYGTYQLEIRSVGHKILIEELIVNTPSVMLKSSLEESNLTMDEVVVTATMAPSYVSTSPVKIDVITSEYINTFAPAAATSLVESVSLVNGVQEVVACGVCFTNSISINGLPGPYTAVLMDGSPIYGNLASVYGLNGIPSTIIERFEVIKGPSSTLYGSEAVAGVINIITKDPANQPTLAVDVMETSHLETFANLSYTPKLGRSKGFIGLNYAYINDFDDVNEDGFSDNVNLDRLSLFTKWSIYRPSGRDFTLTGKYYYEDRRNGVEAFLANRNYRELRGSSEIYGESIYTERFELFGKYEISNGLRAEYSLSTHQQDSYYGSDFYKASQQIFFNNFIYENQYGDHQFVTGLTTRYQAYDDNTVATEDVTGNNPGDQFIPGIFIQDEWNIGSKISLLNGGRLDYYENHGMIASPRISSKYKVGDWTTARANFGTGFRIVNLFTEDHAFVTGQREVEILEDLRPEESINLSLNVNHIYTIGESQGMLDVDAFYTYFSNKITPDYSVSDKIIYANTDGFAISKGISLNLQHELSAPLSFNLGFNLQDVTETEAGTTRNIEFAPEWTGVFTASYRVRQTTFAYSSSFTGPMALPEVYDIGENGEPLAASRPTQSEAFSLHSLQVTQKTGKMTSFYFGIQNLLNFRQPWSPLVGYNDPNSTAGFSDTFDTAYAYAPLHGREFYVGINWSLK